MSLVLECLGPFVASSSLSISLSLSFLDSFLPTPHLSCFVCSLSLSLISISLLHSQVPTLHDSLLSPQSSHPCSSLLHACSPLFNSRLTLSHTPILLILLPSHWFCPILHVPSTQSPLMWVIPIHSVLLPIPTLAHTSMLLWGPRPFKSLVFMHVPCVNTCGFLVKRPLICIDL